MAMNLAYIRNRK